MRRGRIRLLLRNFDLAVFIQPFRVSGLPHHLRAYILKFLRLKGGRGYHDMIYCEIENGEEGL